MKILYNYSLIVFCLLVSYRSVAQSGRLKPGFEKAELIDMLKVAGGHVDSVTIGMPERYKKLYRSPIVGLDNRWELWQRDDGVGVISIRGTTLDPLGWLENFYAAMIPATGQLQLSETESFSYKLAKNPRAAVHAGWVIGMAYLVKDIMPKLDSCIQKGTKEFIVTGDSQGGAISFLMTSYLTSQLGNRLPADVRLKTYCIAAPKPGNLSYAYDYEVITQGGWGFNVVNSADWVPEIPMSIQTSNDFNQTNPFVGVPQMIRKQKFFNRIALNYAFNKLDKPTKKAQKQYQRFLGTYIERIVGKNLPNYQAPAYVESNHYVRTGQTIVLDADEVYYQQFPNDTKKLFMHHFLKPYLFLANRLK
ncbi:lipase family protein [Spirosoma agri]|uniref:Lipase family protein n=1 Tax=Spirosoma agri TaxID=1987381 RepID=A0A6M0IE77_9BACT|nr:lipase family protein [Spirosoma agri]NEU66127.1 lipase family protein [Spirosoma agri]